MGSSFKIKDYVLTCRDSLLSPAAGLILILGKTLFPGLCAKFQWLFAAGVPLLARPAVPQTPTAFNTKAQGTSAADATLGNRSHKSSPRAPTGFHTQPSASICRKTSWPKLQILPRNSSAAIPHKMLATHGGGGLTSP